MREKVTERENILVLWADCVSVIVVCICFCYFLLVVCQIKNLRKPALLLSITSSLRSLPHSFSSLSLPPCFLLLSLSMPMIQIPFPPSSVFLAALLLFSSTPFRRPQLVLPGWRYCVWGYSILYPEHLCQDSRWHSTYKVVERHSQRINAQKWYLSKRERGEEEMTERREEGREVGYREERREEEKTKKRGWCGERRTTTKEKQDRSRRGNPFVTLIACFFCLLILPSTHTAHVYSKRAVSRCGATEWSGVHDVQ